MYKLSIKQVMMLFFVGLLSPLIRVLPGRMTAIAGEPAWLGALFALIPAVLLGLILCDLLRRPGEDLTDAICRAFGAGAGRVLCFAVGLWQVVLCSLLVRLFGERFLATAYIGEPVQLFVILLLIMVFYAARKYLCVLARSGQIFFWVLTIVLALVLGLSATSIDRRNLLPIALSDLPASALAVRPVLGVLGGGCTLTLLVRNVQREGKAVRALLVTLLGLAIASAAVVLCATGNFGVPMLQRMQVPFFMLVKGIRIVDVFERVESLVIALWMITDFVLVTVTVKAAARSFARTFGAEPEGSSVTPVLLLVLLGSVLIAPNAFALLQLSERVVEPINIVFGFGFIPLIWVVTKVRKKTAKKS